MTSKPFQCASCLSEVGGVLDDIPHEADPVQIEIVDATECAAGARQARVVGNRHAVFGEVRRCHELVVHHVEVPTDSPEIPEARRQSRHDLMLQARRELPVRRAGRPSRSESRDRRTCSASCVPKLRSDHPWHSPFVTGLSRSQSGTKLLLVSVHTRFTDVTKVVAGWLARAYESNPVPRLCWRSP